MTTITRVITRENLLEDVKALLPLHDRDRASYNMFTRNLLRSMLDVFVPDTRHSFAGPDDAEDEEDPFYGKDWINVGSSYEEGEDNLPSIDHTYKEDGEWYVRLNNMTDILVDELDLGIIVQMMDRMREDFKTNLL